MKISKCRKVKTPNRGTPVSAGIDFYVPDDFAAIWIKPGEYANIPSGIKVGISQGEALVAFNKSGIALKGLIVGACVVDSDYQGELHLHVINASCKDIEVSPGDKLVQFLLLSVELRKIEEVTQGDLFKEVTIRGEGGFGSTGTK